VLKKRVIASILLSNGLVVQSVGFKRHMPIGKLENALHFLEKWDIDEVMILDISASRDRRSFNCELLQRASKSIFVSLTVGGGIRSLRDVENVVKSGAEKVSINTAFIDNPSFVEQVAVRFGHQCLVLAADVKRSDSGEFHVYMHSGVDKIMPIKKWIQQAEDAGAGELLINSVEHDGRQIGYDIELLHLVEDMTNLPVIALGGAGKVQDVNELFMQTKINAAAVGNMLYFFEHSTAKIKASLVDKRDDIRKSSFIDYEKWSFESDGRIIPTDIRSIYE